MINKVVLSFIACLFLAGNAILPLGDFSLMRDIPYMYENYAKITTQEEFGVIDFVGDYLLHGKDVFGHNKNDKHQDGSNNVQFQHQANPLNIALFTGHKMLSIIGYEIQYEHPSFAQHFLASGHKNGLLRPPLA